MERLCQRTGGDIVRFPGVLRSEDGDGVDRCLSNACKEEDSFRRRRLTDSLQRVKHGNVILTQRKKPGVGRFAGRPTCECGGSVRSSCRTHLRKDKSLRSTRVPFGHQADTFGKASVHF